ncbi:thioredoxin domain-containing protein [Streptomyces sp. NPDC005840]|uniref:DsbA family protein n=1 Tax=Streptomyces sp. NPDC005840 TaxID=3157072 RepID=UPI0033FA552C
MGNVRRSLAGATAAALAALVMTGCGQRPHYASDGTPLPAAYKEVGQLPERLAADGTTIVVGDPAAPTTVRLYEDPRCPIVEEFEATGAPALHGMTLRRETRTEYVLASFRDDRVGGDGSKRAVNALRAALEAGKFTEYRAVVFAHMRENEDAGGFSTENLLNLAIQVPGLRSATFDSAVSTMKYADFVTASQERYERAGGDDPLGPGTPAVAVNGTWIQGAQRDLIFGRTSFGRLLSQVNS